MREAPQPLPCAATAAATSILLPLSYPEPKLGLAEITKCLKLHEADEGIRTIALARYAAVTLNIDLPSHDVVICRSAQAKWTV